MLLRCAELVTPRVELCNVQFGGVISSASLRRFFPCCLQHVVRIVVDRPVQSTEPEYKLAAPDDDVRKDSPTKDDEESGDDGDNGNVVPLEDSIAATKRESPRQSHVAESSGCMDLCDNREVENAFVEACRKGFPITGFPSQKMP